MLLLRFIIFVIQIGKVPSEGHIDVGDKLMLVTATQYCRLFEFPNSAKHV